MHSYRLDYGEQKKKKSPTKILSSIEIIQNL